MHANKNDTQVYYYQQIGAATAFGGWPIVLSYSSVVFALVLKVFDAKRG